MPEQKTEINVHLVFTTKQVDISQIISTSSTVKQAIQDMILNNKKGLTKIWIQRTLGKVVVTMQSSSIPETIIENTDIKLSELNCNDDCLELTCKRNM